MKSFRFLVLPLLFTACVSGEYNSPPGLTTSRETTAPRPYGITTSDEVARVGETSQRFEIRHGDCGSYDCANDRRRIEIGTSDIPRSHPYMDVPGDTSWYGWSMYIPNDFVDISPATTLLGQVKLVRWRGPLWDFTIHHGYLVFKHAPRGQFDPVDCRVLTVNQIRGRWTDIVVYADYSYENTQRSPMVQVWVNGRLACTGYQPLVTPAMVEHSDSDRIYFKYGIYNGYVSRWLARHGNTPTGLQTFNDFHDDSGGTSRSPTATPFEYDWGVELPTQVVFYDEVRQGDTRAEVDVRMRE